MGFVSLGSAFSSCAGFPGARQIAMAGHQSPGEQYRPVVPPRGFARLCFWRSGTVPGCRVRRCKCVGKNHASDKNQLVITMVWQTLVKTVVRKLVLQGQVKTMVLTKGRFLVWKRLRKMVPMHHTSSLCEIVAAKLGEGCDFEKSQQKIAIANPQHSHLS